jgi:predicted Ser/Thr protein kinase
MANGIILGSGNFATVYDRGNLVLKKGWISPDEVRLQQKAAAIGLAPKVMKSGKDFILMEKVTKEPQVSLPEKLVVLCRLWQAGIAHNDTHSGNWGRLNHGQPCLIDFGMADTDVEGEMLEWKPKIGSAWSKVRKFVG